MWSPFRALNTAVRILRPTSLVVMPVGLLHADGCVSVRARQPHCAGGHGAGSDVRLQALPLVSVVRRRLSQHASRAGASCWWAWGRRTCRCPWRWPASGRLTSTAASGTATRCAGWTPLRSLVPALRNSVAAQPMLFLITAEAAVCMCTNCCVLTSSLECGSPSANSRST